MAHGRPGCSRQAQTQPGHRVRDLFLGAAWLRVSDSRLFVSDISTEKKVGNQPTLSLLKTSSGRKGDRKRSGSGRRLPWKQRGAKPGEEPASGSPSLMSRGATRPVLSFCRSRVCMRVRVYEVPAACQRSHCGASLPQTALGVYLLPHPTVYIVNKLGL